MTDPRHVPSYLQERLSLRKGQRRPVPQSESARERPAGPAPWWRRTLPRPAAPRVTQLPAESAQMPRATAPRAPSPRPVSKMPTLRPHGDVHQGLLRGAQAACERTTNAATEGGPRTRDSGTPSRPQASRRGAGGGCSPDGLPRRGKPATRGSRASPEPRCACAPLQAGGGRVWAGSTTCTELGPALPLPRG